MNVSLVAPLARLIIHVSQSSGTAGTSGASGDGTVVPPLAPGWTLSQLFSVTWDNLTRNGYQTGTAILVATAAAVMASTRKLQGVLVLLVALGGFWLGWLGWNTAFGHDFPLFPGTVSATRIWDIPAQSDRGFLVFAIAGSVASFFVWQKMAGNTARRIFVLASAILGASLCYNVYIALTLV